MKNCFNRDIWIGRIINYDMDNSYVSTFDKFPVFNRQILIKNFVKQISHNSSRAVRHFWEGVWGNLKTIVRYVTHKCLLKFCIRDGIYWTDNKISDRPTWGHQVWALFFIPFTPDIIWVLIWVQHDFVFNRGDIWHISKNNKQLLSFVKSVTEVI